MIKSKNIYYKIKIKKFYIFNIYDKNYIINSNNISNI